MTTARPTHAARVLLALALVTLPAGCATGDDEPGTPSSPSASATAPTPTGSPTEPTTAPTTSASPDPTAGGPVVNGPNSITAPLPGAEVTSPVTARGEGTAFEATLLYTVVEAGTSEVVAEGFTTAGANGEVGPWEIVLELAPGDYTLRVWEPDMSDGASESGPERNLVEVSFTVV